jgi:hypothetical protein
MRPVFIRVYQASIAERIERRLCSREMQQPEDPVLAGMRRMLFPEAVVAASKSPSQCTSLKVFWAIN